MNLIEGWIYHEDDETGSYEAMLPEDIRRITDSTVKIEVVPLGKDEYQVTVDVPDKWWKELGRNGVIKKKIGSDEHGSYYFETEMP